MRGWRPVILTVLFTLIAATLIARTLLGFQYERPTLASEARDTTYQEYNELLERYASAEGVDYPTLRNDLLGERVYGYFADYGPRNAPEDFPTDETRLAYGINAYNALMRIAIARHWPVESPLDIHGAIEPVDGFGIFQARRFRVDGKKISLATLHKQLRANPAYDPRVRLALACGGQSCPTVEAPAYTGVGLDQELSDAVTRLLAQEKHLRVDETSRAIIVHPMLMLYQEEFEAWAQAQSPALSFESWLLAHSPTSLHLEARLAEGYALEAAPISWTVDSLHATDPQPTSTR